MGNWATCLLACAGICLTLVAVLIVSLVNVVYPPPPLCPPGDPACLQAARHDKGTAQGIAFGIALTLASQAFQALTPSP